ncbi:hypothetical protein SNE510_17270 [Streptomyces sp. NE5-10]|nr:hypothetical protein SNE510_17270 [Streptomyces sp. NE5-10]
MRESTYAAVSPATPDPITATLRRFMPAPSCSSFPTRRSRRPPAPSTPSPATTTPPARPRRPEGGGSRGRERRAADLVSVSDLLSIRRERGASPHASLAHRYLSGVPAPRDTYAPARYTDTARPHPRVAFRAKERRTHARTAATRSRRPQ